MKKIIGLNVARQAISFFKEATGNVAITFAITLVPMVAIAGIAVDYSRLSNEQSHLQEALDAAVLAAALEDGSNSEREAAGQSHFAASARNPCDNPANFLIGSDEVTGTASCKVQTTMAGIIGQTHVAVNATAVAGFGSSGSSACVHVLEPSAKESLMLNSDSMIDAPDCMVQVNSSNSNALMGNSNGDITANKICVNGGWQKNSSSDFIPTPKDCNPIADPLAYLSIPAESGDSCDHTDMSINGNTTLWPGVYCGKLELNSGANVTFMPGRYVKRDGEFIVNSGSSANGSGVFFYLTGGDNTRFNINSGSHVNFSAPTSGTYKGIVFFQARNSDADFSILNSDSSSVIEGTIYLPNTKLMLNSYGNISNATPWTLIVVNQLELNSDSIMNINSDYSSSSVPVPDGFDFDSGVSNTVWLKK